MKKVYFLPNLITTASLLCGILAIMNTIRGQVEYDPALSQAYYIQACWLILASAVLDGLDGTVARLTRTASSFGLQFDSLSDVVAFGVAPAFLMYAKLNIIDDKLDITPLMPKVSEAAVALFVICGALRLARFNVQAVREEKRYFTGLPIPAAAGVVVSTFLTVTHFGSDTMMLYRAILVLMVVLSYLMISTVPFPSPKAFHLRGRKPFNLLVSAIIFVCILLAFRKMLEVVAFAGFFTYLIYSVGRATMDKKREPILPKNLPAPGSSAPGAPAIAPGGAGTNPPSSSTT